MVAWMLGSVTGYVIGEHGGRALLDHPGLLENSRQELLAKGDRAVGRYNFLASVTMPAFVSGIFRVRFWIFILGALVAGTGWIGMYVGLSYFFGAELAKRIGNAGAKAILGVIVIVAIGLIVRAGWRGGALPGNRSRRKRSDPKSLPPDPRPHRVSKDVDKRARTTDGWPTTSCSFISLTTWPAGTRRPPAPAPALIPW